MCCIIYIPKGIANPSKEILDTIYEHNPDGIGYLELGKKPWHHKTFNYDYILHVLGYRNIDNACIIHFRAASVGSVSVGNIQPFYDKGCGIYFAHNGTFHNIVANENRSDSNIFFNDIFVPAARARSWDDEILWDDVKTKIERSRVIFANDKGEVKMFAGDPTFRDWVCIDGVYYSRMYDEILDNHE